MAERATAGARHVGVVRVRVAWLSADGTLRAHTIRARIRHGRFHADRALADRTARSIAGRASVVQATILFTGDRRARMRGEMATYRVLGLG